LQHTIFPVGYFCSALFYTTHMFITTAGHLPERTFYVLS
jgi:hypothetical protein